MRSALRQRGLRLAVLAAALSISFLATDVTTGRATIACANPVACENQLPGDPPSDWEVTGSGDPSIQGYATSMSVTPGQKISFKINTPSTGYHIDILRLGWYGGDGARKVASDILPSATLPQTQPACQSDSSTGEIDCGNWGVSASWTVPSNAVSGIYVAHLVRDDSQDAGGDSQIPFVVRDDSSHSDILLPTDDQTWQAYNDYGGNSLYSCTVACPPGNPLGYKAAYAVSYNRPWDGALATDGGASYLWYAEYQMVQFLERNGYDVSYTDDANLDSQGPLLLNHKMIVFNGHDEYWSGGERANVLAARNAGVNLAFFTGNEMFWKTRWSDSIDGSNTPYRTVITYKETHFNGPVDPHDPPTWTGTWADPRFSPPGDGGNPSNALTGQQFAINAGTSDITVPSQYSKLRIWQHTGVASLGSGQSVTLGAGDGTLGYEWDLDVDNGFRPAGEFDVSSTTVNNLQTFVDYGSTTNNEINTDGAPGNPGPTPGATETHHLTLYRAPSGALVFGAGTVQWSWGLDNFNAWQEGTTEPANQAPDPNMQQATVNVFGMMGVQPTTLISGLVTPSTSSDTTPPTSTISNPSSGASVADGSPVTISGSATDSGGGVVAGVEVSTDGGKTWHPATLTNPDATTVSWTYNWTAHGYPSTTIESRAVDDSGNLEAPSDATPVQITCPCSLWGTSTDPTQVPFGEVDSGDGGSVEVGVQFTGTIDTEVTGIRFYKASTNVGPHYASLWDSNGNLLAQGTIITESGSGWQTVTFANPVLIQAGHTYVAGYFAPHGHYSATPGWFYASPAPTPYGGATSTSGPWHALTNQGGTVNGLYSYSATSTFPTNSYQATNYWVDPIFQPVSSAPGQVTGVTATGGIGSASLSWTAPTSGGPATQYTITPYANGVQQATTTVSGSPAPTTATVTGLTFNTTYTFTVQASNSAGHGAASALSNGVVPGQATVPSAPTGVTATPASSEAQVSWQAPANGGLAISSYTVNVTPSGGPTTQVQVNNGSATSTTVTGLTDGTSYTFTVQATNSLGTGSASSASNAAVPDATLFDLTTPGTPDAGDGSSVNLGVQFTANTGGIVSGVRFYKSQANTGAHVGSLWDSSGNLLAQGTFTGESASGWQTLTFSGPIQITPGQTYVVSYFAPNGHYSATSQGLASATANGSLTAPASGSVANGNGVYTYASGSAFPANSYKATNYWVDVLFQPGGTVPKTAPGAPTGVSANPASSQAQVTWTAPAFNGNTPITGYTVTATPASGPSTHVQVNNGSATSAVVTGLTNATSYTFTVAATNAVGTGNASSPSSAVAPEDTLFDFNAPATPDSGDTSSANLGVQFTASSGGEVTGIRFYKAQANTGTHVGSLWDASGNLLAQGTFTGESASGWQTLTFSSPVTITAGQTYVASYLAPGGHYSATAGGLSDGAANGPLSATANGSVANGNGVYAYSSSSVFPTHSYNATNYWVDVLFQSDGGPNATAPGAPGAAVASPASSEALVAWTAPSSDGGAAVSGYTITATPASGPSTQVQVNNGSATSAVVSGLTNGTSYTFTVAATNAVGTGNASSPSNAVVPEDTLFDFATPGTPDAGDSSSVNLGVQFNASTGGRVIGLRFYKASANTGTHVGSLWDSSGNLLAQGTFTGESASGWQTLTFSTPVTITAGQTYVASYLAPNGHYSASAQSLTSAAANGPLTAPASGSVTNGNGVYVYSSASEFPTNSYNATNYWVDVLFAPSS